MKLAHHGTEFIVIGENIHTTRVLLRKGKHITVRPDGAEVIRFADTQGETRELLIPEAVKKSSEFQEGRVKHIKVAVLHAMKDSGEQRDNALEYLRVQVSRQIANGADYLDLNVDEISLREREQQEAMVWLVQLIERMSSVPVCIDSSNAETIRIGLETCRNPAGKAMLNSASLERISSLDVALKFQTPVVVTAAGESGMPQDTGMRVDNASRLVDQALKKGIALHDIYIDPLIFPISVDSAFGGHALEAFATLRSRYGAQIHLTGGLSNISFGLPCRRLINDVFFILAIEAGADSGIIDPATSSPAHVFGLDRSSVAFRLAEAVLRGADCGCKAFLKAFRKGDLNAIATPVNA